MQLIGQTQLLQSFQVGQYFTLQHGQRAMESFCICLLNTRLLHWQFLDPWLADFMPW